MLIYALLGGEGQGRGAGGSGYKNYTVKLFSLLSPRLMHQNINWRGGGGGGGKGGGLGEGGEGII
jgi:hypothetical protein